MMLELFGIIFGGVSRLAQAWVENKEKQAERDHEHRMYEQQLKMNEQKFQADAALRTMDAAAAEVQSEYALMTASIQAQADEAKSAGGFVAKLSGSVRPAISYWLMLIYSTSKIATIYLSMQSGVSFASAVVAVYSPFDGALLGSIVSFWFADRSLRKLGR